MKKKDTKGMGHNNPPKELADLTNEQGRVKINKEAMALLKPVPDSNDPEGKKYLERVINDTEVIGFKGKVNPGGSRSYFYQYTPKGRDEKKTA
jgi:hypothetical protein